MKCSKKRLEVFGLGLALVAIVGCGSKTSETIDPADLAGHWELTSSDETEWFDLASDGSFTATINRNGFIATTLSQGPHIGVAGTWQLSDHTITFNLASSPEPGLVDQRHSYKILKLTNRNMDTLDARGNKKTLLRGKADQSD